MMARIISARLVQKSKLLQAAIVKIIAASSSLRSSLRITSSSRQRFALARTFWASDSVIRALRAEGCLLSLTGRKIDGTNAVTQTFRAKRMYRTFLRCEALLDSMRN